MAIIIHRGFGLMQMPLDRQDNVSLDFALSVEKLADLGEPRFQLLQLSRLQFHLPACVGDLHALSPVPLIPPERPTSFIALFGNIADSAAKAGFLWQVNLPVRGRARTN
jgi:hypothetical protein